MRKYNYSLIKKTTERFGLARGTADIEYPLGSADGSVALARLFGNTLYSSEKNAYLSVGDKTDGGKYRLSFARPGRNLMSTKTYAELHRAGATGYTVLNDTYYYIIATANDDGKTIISQENIAFKPDTPYTFTATGEVVVFDGFLRVYRSSNDEETENQKGMLPPLSRGQQLEYSELQATERYTQRPNRYNEGSLVKKLEELGIGA